MSTVIGKLTICVLLISNLLLAKVVVENNGKVIHIYDIPNSQITDAIQNVVIDKSVDSVCIKSKNLTVENEIIILDPMKNVKKIDLPPIDSQVCDTFTAISTQLKFLFHKPLNVQSIKMTWTNNRHQTLRECVNNSDTAGTISILIRHANLSFSEALWLVRRIWPFWIEKVPNCFIK